MIDEFRAGRIGGVCDDQREARLYQTVLISTNLILAYIDQHVLGMPRSYRAAGSRSQEYADIEASLDQPYRRDRGYAQRACPKDKSRIKP